MSPQAKKCDTISLILNISRKALTLADVAFEIFGISTILFIQKIFVFRTHKQKGGENPARPLL